MVGNSAIADRSGIVQRKQWLNEPIQEILGAHIQSLIEHPPVQEATSFDFSELMRQMRAGAQEDRQGFERLSGAT